MLKILLALGLAVIVVGAVVFFLSQEEATIPIEQSYGPTPVLPPPNPTLIPTVNIATASSWPEGVMPTPAEGFSVSEFSRGLDHPRMLHVLPNGDVLVAESNKPPKEDKGFSLRGFAMKLVMGAAGAEVPSANRISLLRDADGDGVAELKTAFLKGLNSPFGMALVGSTLYVANTDAIVAFPYVEGATEITAPGTKLADLPGGPINHHWTKDLVAGPDGASLYAGSGSNSNVGENGMAAEENRAAILKVDIATGTTNLFASGLRNPNGLTFNPDSGQLWAVINERDEIGSDLVPDYMTSVQEGGFYGWPYSYFGQNVDVRVEPQNPELVARAIVPDYALGTHTAPLGLAFSAGPLFAGEFANGAFVGQHGSWNRKPRSGYKVIFVPFVDGKPSGMPRDVLTNFVNAQDEAQGRPVGVAIDRNGGLLVADDVGNKVWRVTPTPADEAQ